MASCCVLLAVCAERESLLARRADVLTAGTCLLKNAKRDLAAHVAAIGIKPRFYLNEGLHKHIILNNRFL